MPEFNSEKQILIAAARSLLSDFVPSGLDAILRERLDWNYILGASGMHGIAPLLYAMLARCDLQKLVPEDANDSLRSNYLSSLMKNKKLYQTLAPLQDSFAVHSIPMMLLKGGALGVTLYDDFGLRPFSDLDILVDKAHVPECMELLEQHGLKVVHDAYGDIPDVRNYELGCEWMYISENGYIIELHWSLMPKNSPFELDTDSYWDHAIPVEFEGRPALAMGAEDQLIHLCLHQYKHHWEHLRDLTDVALLIDHYGKSLDWRAVAERAATLKAERCVLHTLSLAARVLGVGIPHEAFTNLQAHYQPGIMARALEDMIASNIFEENMPRRFWELILVDGLKNKFTIVREILGRPFPRMGEKEQFGKQKAHDIKGKIQAALKSIMYYRRMITAYPAHLFRALRHRGR